MRFISSWLPTTTEPVRFRSYKNTDHYRDAGTDFSCNSHYHTRFETPWYFFTELVKDPLTGEKVDTPADGDSVYLLVAPLLSVKQFCRDGETGALGKYTDAANTGNENDNDFDCLSGAIAAGQRGYCFIPVTISENGTRLTYDGTLTGTHNRNDVATPASETITIDLHRIVNRI